MIEICPGELTIGARVICSAPVGYNGAGNEVGVVLEIENDEILVQFGDSVQGHDGFASQKYAHLPKTLWWVSEEHLQRIG